MKKNSIFKIILFLIVLVLVTVCVTEKKKEAPSETSISKTEMKRILQKGVDEKDEKRIRGEVVSSANSAYQIATETYIAKNGWLNIVVSYPQILNLGDNERQERINELIRKEAVPLMFLVRPDDEDRLFRLQIKYKITWQSQRLLSIQYSGVGFVKGEPHPNNFFYTTNIDIAKGSKLILHDLVSINENFVEKFRDENIKTVSPHPGALSGKNIFVDRPTRNAIEDMINSFTKADMVDADGWLPDTFSYFTADSFGISTGIDHAIGDHAEFEIKYEDIAKHIKTENEVWKDFFTNNGQHMH